MPVARIRQTADQHFLAEPHPAVLDIDEMPQQWRSVDAGTAELRRRIRKAGPFGRLQPVRPAPPLWPPR